MDIGIVILNYLNYEDTIECVNSILVQSLKPKNIVVVDNHSNNESYTMLKQEFDGYDSVEIIELKENLGFARGNNAGIQICRSKGLQNILVINNDTVIYENDFIEKLIRISYNNKIGIIGPKIIGKDGLDQNPVYTENSLFQMLRRLNYSLLSDLSFYKILKKKISKKAQYNNENKNNVKQKFILHGSALFFTENFFKYYEGFYPGTFLYVEENILAYMLQKVNLKFHFVDKISIFHKEDKSSAMAFSNSKSIYKKFMAKSSLVAIGVYFNSYKSISKKIQKDMKMLSLKYIK